MAKTESVSAQMKEILDDYDDRVREVTETSINKVSKESVTKLRNTSPKRTGSYARGWTSKKLKVHGAVVDVVVHNSTNYQLTHLLENGHIIRNAKGEYGRAPAVKHIAPIEEWAVDELPAEIERGLL